jgi:ABC-2 type transport system permease protein
MNRIATAIFFTIAAGVLLSLRLKFVPVNLPENITTNWQNTYDWFRLLLLLGGVAMAYCAVLGWGSALSPGFGTLLERELKSTFYSPIAYVVLFFFTVAFGATFYSGISFLNMGPTEVTVVEATFNTVLFWFAYILIFPLIAMRTYADEFRLGTFEMLTTAPVRDWQVVLAKFFGAFTFYLTLWSLTAIHLFLFEKLTGKEAALGWGAFFGSYLLLALNGGFYIAIGCVASSLCKEQINAAIISFAAIFLAFVAGLLSFIVQVTNPVVRDLISYVSPLEHMGDFSRGLIDSRPIVWYVSMTLLVLFINFQIFQRRKWRA